MAELRVPFVLWLRGDVEPNLSGMFDPVRIPVRLHPDQSPVSRVADPTDRTVPAGTGQVSHD